MSLNVINDGRLEPVNAFACFSPSFPWQRLSVAIRASSSLAYRPKLPRSFLLQTRRSRGGTISCNIKPSERNDVSMPGYIHTDKRHKVFHFAFVHLLVTGPFAKKALLTCSRRQATYTRRLRQTTESMSFTIAHNEFGPVQH